MMWIKKPETGQIIAGRFEIIRRITSGGATAVVYLAQDISQPGTRIALKCARRHGVDLYACQDHLKREAATLRSLTHEGIVRILPAAEPDLYAARADTLSGQPWYLVMEYLAGGTLASLMRRITQQPVAFRLALMVQIAGIVAYLHEAGLAHGDLKPEHVLFRQQQGSPLNLLQPVLIDFGSASPLDESLSDIALTIPYAAPELLDTLQGDACTLAAGPLDIWALGAIVAEIGSGRRLMRGFTRQQMIACIRRGRFSLMHLPPPLAELTAAMLHPDPLQRPTAGSIYRVLQTF